MGGNRLIHALAIRKRAIVEAWLARTLQSYPEQTARFLSQEKDSFRNPAGCTLAKALPALFDQAVEGPDAAAMARLLDPVVRLRAVQDFSAAQAVAFIFLLKAAMREALGTEGGSDPDREALAAVEARVDEMALLAFDLYMRCREQLYEIQANETRRRLFVPARVRGEATGTG